MIQSFLFGIDLLIGPLVYIWQGSGQPKQILDHEHLFSSERKYHYPYQCPCSNTDPKTVGTLHFMRINYFERHLRMITKCLASEPFIIHYFSFFLYGIICYHALFNNICLYFCRL